LVVPLRRLRPEVKDKSGQCVAGLAGGGGKGGGGEGAGGEGCGFKVGGAAGVGGEGDSHPDWAMTTSGELRHFQKLLVANSAGFLE